MSKQVSLSDISESLNKLTNLVNTIKSSSDTTNTQISEIYYMLTNLSMKTDILGQNISLDLDNEMSDQKSSKRKPIKAPAKKGSRSSQVKKISIKKKNDDTEDNEDIEHNKTISNSKDKKKSKEKSQEEPNGSINEDNDDEDNDDEYNDDEDTKHNKVNDEDKKKLKEKSQEEPDGSINEDNGDEDNDDEDNDNEDNDNESNPRKKNINRKVSEKNKESIPKKSRTKKPASDIHEKKSRQLNKMEFFNLKFDEDETYFNGVLTEKDRNTLLLKNKEEWSKLKGNSLHMSKRKAYYQFIKDNYGDKLNALKSLWQEEQEAKKIITLHKE